MNTRREIIQKAFNDIGLKYIKNYISTKSEEEQEHLNKILFGLFSIAYNEGYGRGFLKGMSNE